MVEYVIASLVFGLCLVMFADHRSPLNVLDILHKYYTGIVVSTHQPIP